MQYADKLQQEITRLATVCGLDLQTVGANYYLEKLHVYHLAVLVRSENRIAVVYRNSIGSVIFMEIFVTPHGWVPLSNHVIGEEPVIGAESDDSGNGFKIRDAKRYEYLTHICNAAAKEIHSRHFEDEDVKLTIFKPEKISAK